MSVIFCVCLCVCVCVDLNLSVPEGIANLSFHSIMSPFSNSMNVGNITSTSCISLKYYF